MTDAAPLPTPPPEAVEALLEQAIAAHRDWQHELARELYERILAQQPRHADARHNLGVLLAVQLLQPKQALPHFEAALDADPTRGQYWFSYLDALIRAGEPEAVRQLVPLARQFGLQESLINALLHRLSEPAEPVLDAQAQMQALVAHFKRGEFAAGERQARAWAEREPGQGLAWKALGTMLQPQGRLDEALSAKRRAAELLPGDAEAQNNLGRALLEMGQPDEAVQVLRRAVALKPDYAQAHSNLGSALAAVGRAHEALASLRQAVTLAPDLVAAYNNLSGALTVQGRLDEALAALRRAQTLSPDNPSVADNLLFTLNYDADKSAQEIYQAYQEYERRFGEPLRQEWQAHGNAPLAGRRLKIGYVSPDFRNHACRFFLEPLLAHHDPLVVEVYAYAELAREDMLTARYKGYVAHWVPTRGMSDAALAQRIRADGIDVLVDLAGHTAGNRLGVFARKPAPVSLSWLGFGYTTGLKAIDYLLTDATQAPEGSEALYSETPWRLPGTGYAYRPGTDMGEVGELPALRNGYVTFGTLTRAVRINHKSIRVWSEILKQVPNARLVIDSGSYKDQATCEELAERFQAQGIDTSRVSIGCHSPPWDVLRGVDIGLDCFPHNSGTTLFETLYMGVPYITLAGRPSVGRLGSTILEGLGCPEWIAQTEEDYIAKAVQLASDTQALADVRRGLRARMQASPLMDEAGFAHRVEAAYGQMFTLWAERKTAPGMHQPAGAQGALDAPEPARVQQLVTLFQQGQYAQGEQLARAMVQRFPAHGFGWKALGSMLQPQGRLTEAIQAKRKAVALLPMDAEAQGNLGHLLQIQGLYDEAEQVLRKAVALDAGNVAALNNLGLTLQKTSRLREAEACFRQALKRQPDHEDVYGNLLFTLNYDPDYSAPKIFEAYKDYERRFGAPLKKHWQPHANPARADRRLKVGYVSGDFLNHAVQHFLEPLLAHHDPSVVEVYAYAELAREDMLTARYKGYVAHWVPTRGMSDAALAQRIRADGIDVLVDLAGHTAGNRLGVFARKPAPVSLSWLGFGYTTGLKAIDYLLTDATQAPEGSEALYSETPWRLPGTGYAYRPGTDMGEVGELPALRNGYVTFGTLTRAVRINHKSIRVWSEILKQLPNARLVVDSRSFVDAPACQALAERFQAQGIDTSRVSIGCHSPPWDVLRGVDIGLDCFPHNSGTTLFETLYMGVPYITLAGRPSVGRLGSTILEGLGCPEWIAQTEEDYIAKAVQLASDTQALADVRRGLRARMQASPLMDEAGFAHRVEAAYGDMFDRWHARSAGPRAAAPATSVTAAVAPSLDDMNALTALFKQGQYVQGERLARAMTARFPQEGFAWKALGALLHAQDKLAEAVAAKRRAAELLPGDWEAQGNLARALHEAGALDEALRIFQVIAQARPDDAGAHNNLGFLLNDLKRFDEAQACYQRALQLQPDFVVAWNNLASSQKDQGRLVLAEASARQGLRLNPRLGALHANLAAIFQRQGRLPEAVQSLQQALEINPDDVHSYGSLLFVLNYHADKSAEEIFEAYREFDRRFGLPARAHWRPHANPPLAGRRLKVGYVSPDFCNHPCRFYLEPLLERHDPQAVELYAYAELVAEDALTARYKDLVEHWVPTRGLSDAALAERVRADGIDILVDVAGHTGGNRLGMFALKPAPVSLSWLGYGYTTGLSAIDYYLTDEASAPPGSEALFAERPWRMPTPCYAYRPGDGAGPVGELPAQRNGHITFGTLTRAVRINHHTVRVWSRILQQLPDARLVIDSGSYQDADMQDELAARFAAHGIERHRLLIGCHPSWQVLGGLDIGLDCFPHNSMTTLLETLYMGVPFVTLAGRPSVGRLGSAILCGLGRPQWIAETEDQYVAQAVALASDRDALAKLRAGLRAQMQRSPLMDEVGFAHALEADYRKMFEQWRATQAPQPREGTLAGGNDALRQLEAKLRSILKILPLEADMHYDLGNNLRDQGRVAEAQASWRQALALQPDHADAQSNLAISLQQQDQWLEAEQLLRRVVALRPGQATACYNLGVNLLAQQDVAGAKASFEQALQLKPDFAAAHANLGKLLQESGELLEAEVVWRRALQALPEFATAYTQLGACLQQQGRLGEAEVCYRQAVRLEPDDHQAHFQLGLNLAQLGKPSEAEACYRQALALDPTLVAVWSNLVDVLCSMGRTEEAQACAQRALSLDGQNVAAHGNLATALLHRGHLVEAQQSFWRALALAPDHKQIYSNLLFTLNYDADKSAQEIYQAYQEYERRFGEPLRQEWQAHGNAPLAGRRLKIGYVSPDFRNHACRFFLEPLLAHHDPLVVEVYAYAELAREDMLTARYKGYVAHWVPTRGMSDAALAQRIRADGIDVLVDLAGHTAGNRLGVFARKPAPVSLSWLGFGYTTGLKAIDYLLTDATQAPEGSEALYSETPWRLPGTGYAYRPGTDMGEVGELPALRNGYVTFGTLTRAVRINHKSIRVWSEILKQVPNARLVIDSGSYKDQATCEELAERFQAQGIDTSRVSIGCHSPPWDVLRGVDIGLDCFPHNSGTTLFETLYMGVPYITLAGRPSVGRLGSTILEGLGCPEWIAQTEEDYIAKAVQLASDTQALADVRRGLRARMQASPLMDEAGFAHRVEAAYGQMFTLWAERKTA